MYGFTPPAVIAVDAEWLVDMGDMQRIAFALRQQLSRRPVWAVVGAPERIMDAPAAERAMLLESFFDDPRAAPQDIDEPAAVMAEALRHHLAGLGVPLRVQPTPVPLQPHHGQSAIVPGTWRDAAMVAQALSAPQVIAWAAQADWVPKRVAGVPFVFERPDGPMAGSWDGATAL